MTAPDPARRTSPERGPVAAVARLLLGQLLAVIGIAAAITAVAAAVGPDNNNNNDDVSAVIPSSSATTTATPEAETPTMSVPVTPPGSSTPSPARTTPTTQTPATVVKVDVLNQSAPDGSAGELADRLRRAGWSIGRVDDFSGNVRTTTVYWLDPEQRRQARQISRFLGGVRVQEGFDTLVDGRVSVILVD